MLSKNLYNLLLNKFLKLNYYLNNNLDNNSLKNADLYLLNPKGLKCLLWFTNIKNVNIVCTIYFNINSKTYNIKNNYIICCDDILFSCNGTLFNGVLFNYNNTSYFSCNDIIYYKNIYVNNFNYNKKLYILKYIFNNYIKQISYNKNFIIVGLPIITNNLNNLINNSKNMLYNVHSISYINFSFSKLYNFKKLFKNDIYGYFKIKPEINYDIYNLYCKNDIYYSKAFINDYKTSVMMNNLFRNIKENKNLDLLEESDDEDEFQNNNIDKFVYLDRSYIMKCLYIKEFKLWKPISIENKLYENSIEEINKLI